MLAASPSKAQVTSMSLMGSVQTDEQKPLQGAAITVIHMPSGVRHVAASDVVGRFLARNLMVGGPYLIRVGQGGYQPQTVENIFLETGKTANFTVILSKLDDGKDRNNRSDAQASEPNGSTLTLAKEAVVGGPVLITTTPRQLSATAGAGERRLLPRRKKLPSLPPTTGTTATPLAGPLHG
ncbi:carboxypeptidase-like regulatory domain-containing protein [Hymenobacter terrenus]|uniref:carboxypeptidase-like regulatory domain-containing protein n=1 Tax=Hymenobacter terrenus TaxID=1629124 RepID=UPI000619BEFE|nr:carboxypeptidase-like regulatory domain-containing protein [Hymenobacter terrenus]